MERSHDTIVQIVRESAEHCRQKGLDNNPVEILRFYHTQIVQGRMLKVNDPTVIVQKEKPTRLLSTMTTC